MSRYFYSFVTLLAIASISLTAYAQTPTTGSDLPETPADSPVKPETDRDAPIVQIAILLDNSGSMSGLINQAREELWRVVNEMTTAKLNGKTPVMNVALYTYGSPPPKQLSKLSDDLDAVSAALFAVKISGGSEYCGQVIQTATRGLEWSSNPNDLKLIFIAGNEPFTQGPIDYRVACKEAIAKGITINTIHCGNGIPAGWRDGALLADGKPMSINQNAQVAHVEAPQDKKIAELSGELNKTYIPFGAQGKFNAARQKAQDGNASGLSLNSSVQRAVSKANGFYRNGSWDLVDATKDGTVELAKVKKEDLPDNMKKMNLKEQQEYVDTQMASRKRIQKQINDLNSERNKVVAKKRKEMIEKSGEKTLDMVLVEALRKQASAKNFKFDKTEK